MKTRMHKTTVLIAAALAIAAAASAETVTVRPKATDEVLINPGMGWVFYKYSNRLWAYGVNTPTEDTLDWFPGCSTIYYGLYRLAWADVKRRT